MKAALLSGIVCLALVAPAAALATSKEETRLRQVAADYAKCVVHKSRAKASEAVLSTADNKAVMRKFTQIIDSDCMLKSVEADAEAVQMRFPGTTLQGAIADALVNADFATRGDESFADRLPLAQPAMLEPEQEASELAKAKDERERQVLQAAFVEYKARAWMAAYGECVVRQNPEGARYWLLTPPDAPDEMSRIKALQPALSACLRAGSIKFTRTILRGTVAINYYRLALATRVPAAGGNN